MKVFEEIESVVYRHYGRPIGEMVVKNKHDEFIKPRFLTWYLLSKAGVAKAAIARSYMYNHASIINGIKKVNGWIDTDITYKDMVEDVERKLITNDRSYLQARFVVRRQAMVMIHDCPICRKHVSSLEGRKYIYCSECGTKIKLEI